MQYLKKDAFQFLCFIYHKIIRLILEFKKILEHIVVVAQLLSRVQLFATPWAAAPQASRYFTLSWSLLRLMPIELVMPSNHLILCYFLLLMPSIFPNIRVFSSELALSIRWPKFWSFSFSTSPSALPMSIQGWFSLGLTGLISLQSKGLSNTTVQKHQFFSAQPSSQCNSHIHTCPQEKP